MSQRKETSSDTERLQARREHDYLRGRVERLEAQLARTEAELRAAGEANRRFRELVRQLRLDLEDVLGSARWRVGDLLVGAVERLLGRGRPELLIHHMQTLLERYDDAPEAGDWQFAPPRVIAPGSSGEGDARPLATWIEWVAPQQTAFGRWLSDARIRPRDAGVIPELLERELAQLRELVEATPVTGEPPLVSVIMPAYNRADIIADAITSVCEQVYPNWELLVCDDGSSDATAEAVEGFEDDRIRLIRAQHAGAAAARNRALEAAHGSLIAYLDSDNLWHPGYLAGMVATLFADPGRWCAYAAYFDMEIRSADTRLRAAAAQPFDYERLSEKNFIDLNSFVHRAELFHTLGGFTEELPRQQDWDLVLKYTFLRPPALLDLRLAVYRRNHRWNQLTRLREATRETTQRIIDGHLADWYAQGLPVASRRRRVTVLVWDICRNHFSKAYNVAEALSRDHQVQLLGFRFFDAPIFPPYAEAEPAFVTDYLDGARFPAFAERMAEVLRRIRGEVIYCVKPRLPSLGVALLANYHHGIPVIVESNDLESRVSSPDRAETPAGELDLADDALLNPYDDAWTASLESLLPRLPYKTTHNENLNRALGGGAVFVRNLKDERHFDPDRFDRDAERRELGFSAGERVILFAGLVRRHKGVFELDRLLASAPPSYRLLVAASRDTPDLGRLREKAGERVRVLPPVDRNAMAAVTVAADAVVLWLDPATAASHHQMPYKLTDALAMGVPVFANRVSDLEALIEAGVVTEVAYGDGGGLVDAIDSLYGDPGRLAALRGRGRRLFLREFSYAACRANLELLFKRLDGQAESYPGAAEFARRFDAFCRRSRLFGK